MNNFQQSGDTLDLTAPSGGVVSGTPVLIGRLLVVPQSTVAQTLTFAGRCEGVFSSMAKATGTAWTEGEVLYWDDSAKKFDTVSTGNLAVGYAAEAAGSGATTGTVKLDPGLTPSATISALAGSMTGTTDGTITDVAAIALSTSGGNTYSDAAVNTAVNTAITSVNLQLKELQVKLNALIAAV